MADEVGSALESGRAVVALESTLLSHGLPHPRNREVAGALEDTVRGRGAVPATIAVIDGTVRIGLDEAALDAICAASPSDVIAKATTRDLAMHVVARTTAATTVAATAHLAAMAGIPFFATGGLGGVHRGARDSWDESADLVALSCTPITVVCSGVKSILDVAATLERLESLGVTVVGYATSRFPGFFVPDSGFPVRQRIDSPEEGARLEHTQRDLGIDAAIVVAQPVSSESQVDQSLHDSVVAEALDAAASQGVSGADVTPFVLDMLHRRSSGATLAANVALVTANADLAARMAVAHAALTRADAATAEPS